ncbi:hypothetical protein [Bdellovibrio sp. HCB2-146]|uniref:hypothetical protein n=1 Tax=Bdellovibrio sp. HCB2-146 TaxID=3394362 RepID=UPI0039BD4714
MLNKILIASLMAISATSAHAAMYEISRQDRVSCRDTAGNVRVVLKYDTNVDVEVPVTIYFDGEKAIARNTISLEKGVGVFAGATGTDGKFVIKAFRHLRSYTTEATLDGEWQELKCSTSTKFKVK